MINRYVTLAAVVGLGGAVYLIDQNGYDRGHKVATATEEKKLERIERAYSDQRAQVAADQLLDYQQQVNRANAAEQDLMDAQTQIGQLSKQLEERIPHVTTVYRKTLQASPVAIPHCVFTRGWLRDYNAALGATASVPAARTGTAAAASEKAAEPAPGSDAELLESDVSPADILAHARDYGAWCNTNLSQLNSVLDLHTNEDEE